MNERKMRLAIWYFFEHKKKIFLTHYILLRIITPKNVKHTVSLTTKLGMKIDKLITNYIF